MLESSAALGASSRGRGLRSPCEAGHRVEPRGGKGSAPAPPVEEGAFPIRAGGAAAGVGCQGRTGNSGRTTGKSAGPPAPALFVTGL
ncbi:MAG: hypothetical protein JWN05_1343 [Arthrobacter sp.]|nr:hypothetical protein [Arthrobacter sp.]